MEKLAAILSMILLTGKGLLFGGETVPTSLQPNPTISESSVKEDETGFITVVDTADLFAVTVPADWKTLYVPEGKGVKSGIVAFNGNETILMRNYVTGENTLADDISCNTPVSGQIIIDELPTNYFECQGTNGTKLLTVSLFKDKLYYHYLFQYDSIEIPQGSELAKTILASISFIK